MTKQEMIEYIKQMYFTYSEDFDGQIEECTSVTEMLHTYACYTGKLEALLDGLTIGGKQ